MRKGFTLMEMLTVVAILAIIAVISVPAIVSVANRSKQNMYCKKVQTALKAAQLYGEDNRSILNGDIKCLSGEKQIKNCQVVMLKDLSDKGYLALESIDNSPNKTEFLDPRSFTSMLNEQVMVFIVNKRVSASFIYSNQKDGEKCTNAIKVGGQSYKEFYYKNGGVITAN